MSRVIHDYMYLCKCIEISAYWDIRNLTKIINFFVKYDEESIDECSCW